MFLCGIELMDPRSVPLDGGVFSRSIPVSSHTPRLGMLTGASSDIKSKCWEQYQHQQTNRNDNRLKTFGTTYLSDDAPRLATVTSLDGFEVWPNCCRDTDLKEKKKKRKEKGEKKKNNERIDRKIIRLDFN